MDEEEYLGPYTCIKCLSPTFNDSDVCDECEAEYDEAELENDQEA